MIGNPSSWAHRIRVVDTGDLRVVDTGDAGLQQTAFPLDHGIVAIALDGAGRQLALARGSFEMGKGRPRARIVTTFHPEPAAPAAFQLESDRAMVAGPGQCLAWCQGRWLVARQRGGKWSLLILEKNGNAVAEKQLAGKLLSAILKERDIGLIWQIEEDGTVSEIEVASFDIDQAGDEVFWSTPDLDWIVYVSHESSVTIGGWMLNKLRKLWPTWERALW